MTCESHSLANAVLGDWNVAMNAFFQAVFDEAMRRGVPNNLIRASLSDGYGDVVLDCWDEWVEFE